MLSKVVSVSHIKIDLQPGQKVVFFSDVHLGFGDKATDKQRENLLVNFIRRDCLDARHVFIVGDLFDYWFDYKRVIPRQHIKTLNALQTLREKGIEVTYLMGNHDFGHFTFFEEELDISVEKGDVTLEINNTKIYVSHGDGKALNDMGYLALRSVLRSRLSQFMYRMLHPNIGIGLAACTSHGSREYTAQKDYGKADGLLAFAQEKIAEGYNAVVMGHRHQAGVTKIGNGEYFNLGHWLGLEPHFATFTASNGLQLQSVFIKTRELVNP